MKKLLVFLCILGVAALVLMVTKPDRQQHLDTIQTVVSKAVSAELRDYHIDGDLGSVVSMTATAGINQFLNSSLMVREHTFYNIGVISYDNNFQMVSVGVLNHVYTLNEEQARYIIRTKLKEAITF
ncbi:MULTISPECIES: hypothetical protein [unclassified Prevotella]|uniref:hypothetical protein n=1 Tax=unclassified Prevotella TaxID=2638335 RepID=UPI00048A7E4F|nr:MULTISPECIES: hypothetical protein [unclassified Prevotella]